MVKQRFGATLTETRMRATLTAGAGVPGPPGPQGPPLAIQDEGVSFIQRAALNFTGSGVTATDDVANDRVNIDIPGGVAASQNERILAEAIQQLQELIIAHVAIRDPHYAEVREQQAAIAALLENLTRRE